jgi:hypothetical protein
MQKVNYRLPDKPQKTVAAFVLCTTAEANLLFVPSFDGERPDSLVIAHDDDGDGIFEDMEANWFNTEPKDLREIAANLQLLGSKLR